MAGVEVDVGSDSWMGMPGGVVPSRGRHVQRARGDDKTLFVKFTFLCLKKHVYNLMPLRCSDDEKKKRLARDWHE